jgi:NADH:ubiquinone oxidoreductase subunit K
MADPRDFLTLCRLGAPGLELLVLGLAGVIVQKSALRRSLSFAVLMVGVMLLFDAAARFHRLSPEPVRSLTFLTIALTPLLFTIVRSHAANVRANRRTNDRIGRTDR